MAEAEDREQKDNDRPQEEDVQEEMLVDAQGKEQVDPEATVIGTFNLDADTGELTAEKAEETPDDQGIPNWLQPEFDSDGDALGDTDGSDEEITAVYDVKELVQDENEVEATLEPSEEVVEEQPTETDENLSWLDTMATDEESSQEDDEIVEATAMADDIEETMEGDSLDADLTWLDEMDADASFQEQEEPKSEMEIPTTDVELSPALAEEPESDLGADEALGTVPEDPDEVMAWLEKLAARQGADPEELTTLSGADVPGGDSEEMEVGEIPEDPDEAMAWLEHLAAVEGSLDEEELIVEAEVDALAEAGVLAEADAPAEERLLAEAEPVEEELDAIQAQREAEKAQELDEALSWLEEMVSQPVTDEDELEFVEEETELVEEIEPAAAEEMAAVADIEEMDEDEAMEWLEQLAAKQGASADELTQAIDEEGEGVGADEALTAKAIEGGLEEELIAFEGEAPEEEEFQEEILLVEAVTDEIAVAEEVGAEAPDAGEGEGESSDEDLDWLETLGGVEVETWIEAQEEEVSSPDLKEVDWLEDIKDEVVTLDETEIIEEVVEVPGGESGIISREPDIRFESAQSALREGNLDQAISAYDEFLAQATDVPGLIAELEAAISDHGEQPRLQRILGDAYISEGQTEKAIEVYRQALNNL